MPAYIGITIGGSLESPTPGLAVVVSTTTTTGKDIELVLNTWPAQPVTKTQLLQMATTILAVCNRALSEIAAPRINALTDDTPSALALAACLPAVPDWMLRAYRWRFALKRAVLAEADAVPAFGYGWSFTLPDDRLAVAPEEDSDCTVEGRSLVTNKTPPLRLRYIAQMPDASQWDPAFAEVLACRIALEVQAELGPLRSEASLQAAYKQAVSLAIRSGAIELPVPRARTAQTGPALDDPWLTARL